MYKIIRTNQAPCPIGPYTQGIIFNNIIITSGQIPINPVNGLMPISFKQQTIQVLYNIRAIINKAGFDIINIIKVNIYLINLNNLEQMNILYSNFFSQYCTTYPTRTCVEVSKLPKNASIEMDVIAIK
ncbi:Rid family detoxifying hydrolase [Enterobacteriaceae endosymbiont of Neohaemonia nigricornis]|uniref:Rid family detoxifying hydrolase n=1 Tax=Enterobacteriaceae endosymbiont of Neohaemonia nigricornis TaxID=2675792 RepID=UPI0014491F6F|nr:Rid family detoxifying hydrolase [Enterobacteriaceae endosymbiont of Neohaemonia nigricornis]QJC30353.1 reactive intermediate/imine deaminase [Enterobacteriaceae endosymbiont of Neohaemonia nigricornis]